MGHSSRRGRGLGRTRSARGAVRVSGPGGVRVSRVRPRGTVRVRAVRPGRVRVDRERPRRVRVRVVRAGGVREARVRLGGAMGEARVRPRGVRVAGVRAGGVGATREARGSTGGESGGLGGDARHGGGTVRGCGDNYSICEVVLERIFKMESLKLTSGDGESSEDELEEVHHLCGGGDWKVMREGVRRCV